MKLIVVSPDQVDWSKEEPLYGKRDVPLNSKGAMLAEEIRDNLKTTPLDGIIIPENQRFQVSAELIRGTREIPITKVNGFKDRDYGQLEGRATNTYPLDLLWDYHDEKSPESTESMTSFFQRIYHDLDAMENTYQAETVLLVAPRGVTIPIECYYQGTIPEGSLVDLACQNGEVRSYEKYAAKEK